MWEFFEAIGEGVKNFIRNLGDTPQTSHYTSKVTEAVIEILDNVPGMTPCRTSLFKHSTPKFRLKDGSVVRTWTNRAVGGDHIFIASPDGKMIYGGFVWLYANELKNSIKEIRKKFT